jgi:hypothetical protein
MKIELNYEGEELEIDFYYEGCTNGLDPQPSYFEVNKIMLDGIDVTDSYTEAEIQKAVDKHFDKLES